MQSDFCDKFLAIIIWTVIKNQCVSLSFLSNRKIVGGRLIYLLSRLCYTYWLPRPLTCWRVRSILLVEVLWADRHRLVQRCRDRPVAAACFVSQTSRLCVHLSRSYQYLTMNENTSLQLCRSVTSSLTI